MKQIKQRLMKRINLWIGGILASLGIGATACDSPDFRIVPTDDDTPQDGKIDSLDVVICKYGIPGDIDPIDNPDPKPLEPDTDEVICMYGVPSASFQLRGRVTAKENKHPLPNIEVLIDTQYDQQIVFTDTEGNYHFQTDWIFPSDSVYVTFTDANKVYETKKIGEAMKYDGGDYGFNMGHADMTIDTEMEKK